MPDVLQGDASNGTGMVFSLGRKLWGGYVGSCCDEFRRSHDRFDYIRQKFRGVELR